MQQKDQENKTTPKKHWKKALDMNSNENASPTVAARSAIFENQPQVLPSTQIYSQLIFYSLFITQQYIN